MNVTSVTRSVLALLLHAVFATSSFAQGTMPLKAGDLIERNVKYVSESGNHYLIFQPDGNLVVYTANGGYVGGLDRSNAPFRSTVTIGVEADGNLVGRAIGGRLLWSALAKGVDPQARLMLTPQGELRLESHDLTVLWSLSSNTVVLPESGEMSFVTLQRGIEACREGLQSLRDNMYRYPENPATAPAGRRSWNDALGDFMQNSLSACDDVGAFIDRYHNEPLTFNVRQAMSASGVDGWADYFTGASGIVSSGERIGTYCPSLHLIQFNCENVGGRIEDQISAVNEILDLLDLLECLPEPGWAHCRMISNPSIKILGTVATSQSAMTNVKHVYSEMMRLLRPEYPSSNFDGFIAYLTNDEPWSELANLPPVGTMMGFDADGTPRGDELRGGGGSDYLWITEMMICKAGVATRNQAYEEGRRASRDDVYRTFDQAVHEIGHSIDFRFNLRNRIEIFYAGGWNPVEQFPWNIQAWFGVPAQNLSQREAEFMGELFSERITFTCDNYDPGIVTSIAYDVDMGEQVPTHFGLSQNYPNPFNPSTQIPYHLPANGNVRLDVFDITGRHITTLVNSYQTAGSHSVLFKASNLSSGLYIYRLQAGSVIETRKMILVK